MFILRTFWEGPAGMSSELESPDYVASLARGLAVIRAFGHDAKAMTLTEVARRTDLTRATARRFLHTLRRLGYVASDDGKHFRLTAKVLDLGYAYLSSMDLIAAAQPFMEQVTAETQESCSIAVLDGHDVVYVARVPTKRIMSVTLSIGTRLPAHATSLGRVLLAELSPDELDAYFAAGPLARFTDRTVSEPAELRRRLVEVRRQGYASIDQELEEGLRSISVPLRCRRASRALAALNLSSHASRVTNQDLVRNFLPSLKKAAAGIATALPG
jgi:IclR family transcriptional regulator, pca regulon regulatory protein